MRVKCIHNVLDNLSCSALNEIQEWYGIGYDKIDITVGDYYNVYAVTFDWGIRRLFIASDSFEYIKYPLGYSDCFFEFVDMRVSKLWIRNPPNIHRDDMRLSQKIYSFPQWAYDDNFYEALVDGDSYALNVFAQAKKIMDLEYPYLDYSDRASIMDGRWLSCPACNDAWEERTDQGMLYCPHCECLLINPLYKGKV